MFVGLSVSVSVTGDLLSILLRIVPPFLIRWCNLLAGRAVGQPHSTIQKNVKNFGRFKKNTFICYVNLKLLRIWNRKVLFISVLCTEFLEFKILKRVFVSIHLPRTKNLSSFLRLLSFYLGC